MPRPGAPHHLPPLRRAFRTSVCASTGNSVQYRCKELKEPLGSFANASTLCNLLGMVPRAKRKELAGGFRVCSSRLSSRKPSTSPSDWPKSRASRATRRPPTICRNAREERFACPALPESTGDASAPLTGPGEAQPGDKVPDEGDEQLGQRHRVPPRAIRCSSSALGRYQWYGAWSCSV
jgi:hypothetical protein